MKIIINGIGGHMGQEVMKLALENYRGTELVAGANLIPFECSVPTYLSLSEVTEEAECVVDFSHHTAVKELTEYAVAHHYALVIATTGHTPEEKELINRAAEQVPVFYAANYSMGIAILTDLAVRTAALMPDAEIEIVEMHHDRKVDAPSGTALAIAEAIRTVRPEAENVLGRSGNNAKRTKTEIGIHAIRMGNIVGQHEVIIGTPNQQITLKHEAFSRALFAEGALAAAAWIEGKPAGLYDMKSMIGK